MTTHFPRRRKKRIPLALIILGLVGVLIVALIVVGGIMRATEGDIFELYEKVDAEKKRGGEGWVYLLYQQEGKTFKGEGTVTGYGQWSSSVMEIKVKSDRGREVTLWQVGASSDYKRPPPLKTGDRIRFRCEMAEKFKGSLEPKLLSFEKR